MPGFLRDAFLYNASKETNLSEGGGGIGTGGFGGEGLWEGGGGLRPGGR